jgi:hypothetical protein
MMSPQCVGEPVTWARNLSGMRGTRATVSPTTGGNTSIILRAQGLRCLEAARDMSLI